MGDSNTYKFLEFRSLFECSSVQDARLLNPKHFDEPEISQRSCFSAVPLQLAYPTIPSDTLPIKTARRVPASS